MTSLDENDPGSGVWEQQRRVRAEGQEAIWFAQLILWLPLLTKGLALALFLVTLVFRRPDFVASWHGSAWSVFVSLLFLMLYAVAGWWVGARERRGVWLGIALFAWSLVSAVLHGYPLSFGAGYAVVGLLLVVRAGRALGIPQLLP